MSGPSEGPRGIAASDAAVAESTATVTPFPLVGDDSSEADALTAVIRRLSTAQSLSEVMAVTTHAARALVNADGVTFVLREGDLCHYADEDAIGPLWKGKKFPIKACISGWVMEHANGVVIPDIQNDHRIPQDAYRPTFVKSLAMVPIRQEEPIGAMGAYWARAHTATGDEVNRLQTIANAAALAVAFVQRSEAEAALRDRASMLDALLEYIPEGITIARGRDVMIERVSAEGLKRVQRAEQDLIGIGADLHPGAWQVFDEGGTRLLDSDELPLTRAVRHGETIENEQLSLRLPDGNFLPILCNAGPIRDATGNITGGIIAWRDISDRVKLEQERQLLLRELNHRVKNLFAMVGAMVGLTARNSKDVREMAEALTGRIAALAHAHELIRPAINPVSGHDEAVLQDLIEQLLAPHLGQGTQQCRVSGPKISIGATATTNLTLVIHELATNAAKYGALSTPAGTLEVSWSQDNGSLALTWDEQGAPQVRREARQPGFGSKLINATVRRQLLGTINYSWEGRGLRVDLSLPLKSLQR